MTKVSPSVLANTAVTPGTYGGSSNTAVITVDGQGRLTYAANLSSNTTVTPGTYNTPTITVDAQGRLTFAANSTPRDNIVIVSANTNAFSGNLYVLTSFNITLTLPSSNTSGDSIKIVNMTSYSNNYIGRNGGLIMATAEDLAIDVANASFTLVYTDSTRGWAVF